MDFRVELESFRGPLDLLLYLVRKHEVDIAELPIAVVTEQYLAYLEVLRAAGRECRGGFFGGGQHADRDQIRMVLPRGGEETEAWDDPRDELVARLLEYKKYKDAASMLDERSRDWQQHYPRLASDLPPRADRPRRAADPRGGAVGSGQRPGPHPARSSQANKPSTIVYDDTPIQVYMQRIHASAGREAPGGVFSEMFQPGMHKSAIVGVFLAVLELCRHHSVRAEQNDLHGEIWVVPDEQFDPGKEIVATDNYENRPADGEQNAASR